jgi:FtsP/CotA-like multicopper oxidase with cupredoxin domain
MSRTSRFVSIGVAVVIAVVAVVLLRPDSGSEDADDPPAQEPVQTDAAGKSGAEPTATAEAAPAPPPVEVTVRDYKPVGGVKRIEVEKGDTVRLVVRGDVQDEIHVHGYDLFGDTGPGKPARFRFKAKLEGEYEIEGHQAEDRGLDPLIARLVVTPG